jgi:membrane protease YdiL (CAAX protease family)
VPRDFWTDTANMLLAGGIVAAMALPFGLIAWLAVRRSPQRWLPPWRPWWGPWTFFEVIVAFVVVSILIPETISYVLLRSEGVSSSRKRELPSVEASSAVAGMPVTLAAREQNEQAETAAIIRGLSARVLALPIQLTILLCACRMMFPRWWFMSRPSLEARILLAVVAWVFLTPMVLGVNVAVNILFSIMDWQQDSHPLVKLGGRTLFESALFVFQACVAAPVVEEMIFRGAILAWAMGSRKQQSIPDVPYRIRPLVVAVLGLLFAILSGRIGAMFFSMGLILCLGLVELFFRKKRRTVSAIFASSAFFAAVHSSVWPSPIPLFLLGLGLGWLAVRTRSVLVPIIVHGLFNAVSTLFVLRSAG